MEIQALLELYAAHPGVAALENLLQEGNAKNLSLKGMNGSAGALVIASLFKRCPLPLLAILNDQERQVISTNDLTQLLGNEAVLSSFRYREDINMAISTQPTRSFAQRC